MKKSTHFKQFGGFPNKIRPVELITGTAGFTLIELMVSIIIFSIVITLIFGSFQYVFSTTETLNAKTELNEMAVSCLSRMRTDLQSLYTATPPSYAPPEFNDDPDIHHVIGDSADLSGEEFGRLTFTSMAHLAFRNDIRSGIAQIVYYADLNESDEVVIRRKDNLYPYPEEFEEKDADPILCENVKGLSFTYIDHDNEERERWDSESDEFAFSSPKAIKIKLTLGDDESESIFQTKVALPVFRPPAEEDSNN